MKMLLTILNLVGVIVFTFLAVFCMYYGKWNEASVYVLFIIAMELSDIKTKLK